MEIGDILQNKRGESFEILEKFTKDKYRHYCKIRFLDSGNIRNSREEHIKDGRVRNVKEVNLKIGDILSTNFNGDVEILEKLPLIDFEKFYKVKFLNTGYIDIFRGAQILKGNIRDLFLKKRCNIGYIGKSSLKISKELRKSIHLRWSKMMAKCYDVKDIDYNRYGGKGIKTSEEWLCFSTYLEDVLKLENFNEEKVINGTLQLDKDLKSDDNNKIYSKDTCCWLTAKENNADNMKKLKEAIKNEYV